MSFDISNLALIAHGANRKLYSYVTTADTLATVRASGYFGQDATSGQQSSDMLDANDVIMATATDGHQNLRVDSISGTTITTEMGPGETQILGAPIMNIATSRGFFMAAPFDGAIGRVKLTTNGETLDVGVVNVLLAGTLVTGLAIAIDQSGQGAGEVYQAIATGANLVSEGDPVQVTWDGGVPAEMTTAEMDAYIQIEFVPV